MPAIETQGLRKSFRTRGKLVEAVQGVDLRVEAGEVFGLLGPNGAGKTTTLRMLATLLPPSGGRATVAGRDLLREPGRVRERIGYVGQAGGADQGATAREDLTLQARLYGRGRGAARDRAAELIAALELAAFADRPARTCSGGQRRRRDLALGLVHRPAILFLDEPTTGLDPQSRARLWDEVRRLRADGTAVFLTTHYLDEADALCDRLAIVDGGRVVAAGTPDALKRQIAGDVVTLGLNGQDGARERAAALLAAQPFVREVQAEANGLRLYVERGEAALPALLRLLDGAGLTVGALALARPTLDDVFLRQTGRSLREAPQEGGGNESVRGM
jgi:ABC-2 type transport system ATP-binding protein